jgi:hypothetical protein
MDRHQVDADPDLNFHIAAVPESRSGSDPDWHQMMPILLRTIPQVLLMLEYRNIFLITALPVY